MTSGVVLGRFRLIEKVDACQAAASFTAVNGEFNAWIEWLDENVADAAIQRLKEQRTAIAKLNKARAPELIEFGEHERRTFVAGRRLPGETLASRIERGGLGAIETLDLLIELADALAETHALGIAHGRLSERSIYFALGERRERIEILGFGLAGLTAEMSDQPTVQDDLRALGRVGYACLAGPEAKSVDLPAKVLEKQTHLSKEARDLVLRLLNGGDVASANELGEMAREARRSAAIAIAPVPIHRDTPKIEVVLRTTIEASNAHDDATPLPDLATALAELTHPRSSAPPRGATEPILLNTPIPPNAPKSAPLDRKLLFFACAIVILLIISLWVITTSGIGPSEVIVESIAPE